METYDARTAAELRHYADVEQVHDLPSSHHYWSQRFVRPLLHEVDVAGIDELWESCLEQQCARKAPAMARLVSLGAGNGDTELRLAARLAQRGVTNLQLVLLELNPAMLHRAQQAAEQLGLGERVQTVPADLNAWTATETADVYLAVHSLHHVVELEHLYDEVARSIDPDGVILVNDMIGRNGHVRWPEAARLVHSIWRLAPERYRYNHYLKRIDEEYPDLDCSGEGFEGIRSQDVLPLLLERFHPEVFVTFANVIDPFVDRVYGHNLDPGNPVDAEFIETVGRLDEAAIDLGVLTPTHLIGSFRPQAAECRYPRSRSPQRSVRDPVVVPTPEATAEVRRLEHELLLARERYDSLRARKVVRLGLALAERRHVFRRRLAGLRRRGTPTAR